MENRIVLIRNLVTCFWNTRPHQNLQELPSGTSKNLYRRLQLLEAIQLLTSNTHGLLKNPFSWEEIAFCKNDPKHQFGYTSIGRELKRYDRLCACVYFCSQYFSECLLLAVLINRDKQFECKYTTQHDSFSMASKTRNIPCTHVYLMKIWYSSTFSSREKRDGLSLEISEEYTCPMMSICSSQHGLFVYYMFILAPPTYSVSRRFSVWENSFKRRKCTRIAYNSARKARTKIRTYSKQNDRIYNMFYIIQSQKNKVDILKIHICRYAARELVK